MTMKKLLALLIALTLVLGMTVISASADGIAASDLKIGYIVIGDENEGYSANHLNALYSSVDALGISRDQVLVKYNTPESQEAYDNAIDLVDQGCNIIFATSFGHEDYIRQAAIECPDVQFCHATGSQAMDAGLANFHNYFPAVYEGRYVSGIVAGMKLNEMIANGTITADQAKIGYVGAFDFAEIISGYTAFYLGARSVCPTATMEVKYTNSWGDADLEATAASALIDDGCVLLSQHADTTGVPTTCELRGVYCVGYNIDMTAVAPNTALISPACNWGGFVKYALEAMINGTEIAADWSGSFADDAVFVTPLNASIAPEGAQEAVDNAIAAFKAGEIKVFDVNSFTVPAAGDNYTLDADGRLTSCFAIEGVEVIEDGQFKEQTFRSAPYFALTIDGITIK